MQVSTRCFPSPLKQVINGEISMLLKTQLTKARSAFCDSGIKMILAALGALGVFQRYAPRTLPRRAASHPCR
ncbi:jg19899 [Pararge aegeria aegeria]|uniref:Jg19899 protein n=1 Tax=Pararge aegeria aegeria TaxID=348720 RepID=A0A8S4SFR3_9NEOP|nr:jg19899 [Pararge aegeria aegeria]